MAEWPELPDDIRDKAVEIARKFITPERAKWLREQYAQDKDFWINKAEHFGYGIAIRNAFRQAVITDNMVPKGWDHHYQKIVEIVLGITK